MYQCLTWTSYELENFQEKLKANLAEGIHFVTIFIGRLLKILKCLALIFVQFQMFIFFVCPITLV